MAEHGIQAPSSEIDDQEAEHPPPRLVLASEALREDLAPIEPGRSAGRWLVGGVGLSLTLLGAAFRLGVGSAGTGVDPASLCFAAAGVAVALAALPLTYPLRAGAVTTLGLALLALATLQLGPAASQGSHHGTEIARFVALSLLPGALLFRARYRAYPRARVVLGLALLAALPFIAARSLAALDWAVPAMNRAGAILTAGAVLSGLFGFMGAYTTGGGGVWAAIVLGVLSADIAVRELPGGGSGGGAAGAAGQLGNVGAAIATLGAATLVAIGFSHLLSAWLSRDARSAAGKQAAASPA